MKRPWINLGALLLALTAVLPSSLAAQCIDPTRIIDMHVDVESENAAFDGSVAEGRRFRISIAGSGSYELAPVLAEPRAGRFHVTVYRGPEGAQPSQMRIAGTVTARQGIPVALPGMPSVSLVIDGVRTAQPVAAPSGAQLIARAARAVVRPSLQTECCVRCGNVTACGCRVVHTCDLCCTAGCCRPGDIQQTMNLLPAERTFAQLAGACGQPIKDEERIFTPRATDAPIAFARTR
jgi:hypothetical protein